MEYENCEYTFKDSKIFEIIHIKYLLRLLKLIFHIILFSLRLLV